jgi:hypothetical protein
MGRIVFLPFPASKHSSKYSKGDGRESIALFFFALLRKRAVFLDAIFPRGSRKENKKRGVVSGGREVFRPAFQ